MVGVLENATGLVKVKRCLVKKKKNRASRSRPLTVGDLALNQAMAVRFRSGSLKMPV